MSRDYTWGGQHEINALAQEYGFNVFLHQVGVPSMMHKFHQPISSVPIVHLSYHRGCHYNSVRRMDDPRKTGVPPIEQYPISHDLGITRALVFALNLSPAEMKHIRI